MFHRHAFPILKKSLYLASHSLGAVPAKAEDALREYYEQWATLGILAWDDPWWNSILNFSDDIGKVLGLEKQGIQGRDVIVPMENVTRGFSVIASSFDWQKKKNKILMTDLEFLTSYPFWEGFARSQNARIEIVKSEDGISIPIEKIISAIDDETLLIPTSHVYFRSGAIQDLKSLTTAAHQKGAYVCGDGYQAAGIIPIDVVDMGIDFYVGGSHKWLCGGPGAGYLYVRKDLIQKLVPNFSGWFGIENPFAYEPATSFKPSSGVFRFLAGTPSISALYAAREGIRLNNETGSELIRKHSLQLTEKIIREADKRNLNVKSPRIANERGGMVCIDFKNAKQVTEKLCSQSVIIDYRPNCGIRVSPHYYNTDSEISDFFNQLDDCLKGEK